MRPLTFALLLSFLSLHSFAQKNFTTGYIVKINGDTIHGYLQEEVREELFLKIKFKPDNIDAIFQTFTPSEVKAFKFESGNLYKSISFINTLEDSSKMQTRFALQLVEGTYNLFSYIINERIYFVITGNDLSDLLYNSAYNNNGELKIESNYTTKLTLLASACDKYVLHPEEVSYNEKEVAKFISQLDNCVSPNTVSTDYYQKPKIQTQIILFAGGLPMGSRNQFSAEGMIRLIYPQLSKKISINIGVRYSHTTKTEIDRDDGNFKFTRTIKDGVFSVPLTLQYSFLTWVIRPYVSSGFGLAYLKEETTNIQNALYIPPQNQFKLSVIGAIGIEGYITKRLFVKAEWRYELLVQYPAIGIAYRFK
jgi:hypothetical protein